MKDLADIHFSDATTITLVQDNLNIHAKASLYEAFPAAEARRLVERFEWHYTPCVPRDDITQERIPVESDAQSRESTSG